MTSTSGWFALAGAIGGVLATGLTTILHAALTQRWNAAAARQGILESEAGARRDQRRQAAHDYLVAANAYYEVLDRAHDAHRRGEEVDVRDVGRPTFTALQDAYVYLAISTGSAVRALAHEYNLTLYAAQRATAAEADLVWEQADENVYTKRQQLRAAIRVELNIPD